MTAVCASCVAECELVKHFPEYLLHQGGKGRLTRLVLTVSSELLWQLWQKSFSFMAAVKVVCHLQTCCHH